MLALAVCWLYMNRAALLGGGPWPWRVACGAAALAFAGPPALIQCQMGLPPGVAPALHPGRLWKIWVALVQHCTIVVYAPQYVRWLSTHRTWAHIRRDVAFGSAFGCKADVFDVPAPWGALDKMGLFEEPERESAPAPAPAAGTGTGTGTGDKPVAVFVHGGVWSSGSKVMYVEVGKFLARFGFVAVVPDLVKHV